MKRAPIPVRKEKKSGEQMEGEMDDFIAKTRGRRAYYEGSPSPPAVKRKVAIKMGGK